MPDRKIVAVDLDGTLIDDPGWRGVEHFGDPYPGAVDFTRELATLVHVLIFTARTNPELGRGEAASLLRNRVRDYLDEQGFVYHDIWTGIGKPLAWRFIDHRAIRCAPAKKIARFAIGPRLAEEPPQNWYSAVLKTIRMELGNA